MLTNLLFDDIVLYRSGLLGQFVCDIGDQPVFINPFVGAIHDHSNGNLSYNDHTGEMTSGNHTFDIVAVYRDRGV